GEGPDEFEPSTSVLSTQHSHQMSYDPDLDVKNGYESWEEKLKEIEFDSVDAFENQMFDAIRNSIDK
ncbi:3862_t:CDS:2, partial [Cetraspora pellucida]